MNTWQIHQTRTTLIGIKVIQDGSEQREFICYFGGKSEIQSIGFSDYRLVASLGGNFFKPRM